MPPTLYSMSFIYPPIVSLFVKAIAKRFRVRDFEKYQNPIRLRLVCKRTARAERSLASTVRSRIRPRGVREPRVPHSPLRPIRPTSLYITTNFTCDQLPLSVSLSFWLLRLAKRLDADRSYQYGCRLCRQGVARQSNENRGNSDAPWAPWRVASCPAVCLAARPPSEALQGIATRNSKRERMAILSRTSKVFR